jgi:oxygen-independent coproporphyrinogen-3 oxidase
MQRAAASSRIVNSQTVELDDSCIEFMMNAMRLKQGVAAHLFLTRTGLPLSRFQDLLTMAQAAGLLHWDYKILRPTEKGFLFLNDLLSIFIAEPAISHKDGSYHGPA